MEESVREQLLILWTTPIYFIIILLEIALSSYQNRDSYTVRDSANNFLLMLLNGGKTCKQLRDDEINRD